MMRRIRFDRILCPVDFSQRSKAAFDLACAIARDQQAELRLLHVIEPADAAFATRLDGATHRTVMQRLRGFLKEAAQDDLRLGAAVREGQPAREILGMATRHAADLIVIAAGRPRAQAGSPAGLGHVARTVADRALCPVLLLPASARRTPVAPFRQIVCATDTDPASLVVVGQALSLAQEAQGHVTLVHVEPEPTGTDLYPALASAVPHEALNWCDVRIVVTSGNPALSIVELADAVAADLIVVGAPRAVASVAHAVAASAPCPVLIAHEAPGRVSHVNPRPRAELATA